MPMSFQTEGTVAPAPRCLENSKEAGGGVGEGRGGEAGPKWPQCCCGDFGSSSGLEGVPGSGGGETGWL